MTELGLIKGYYAIIDLTKLGFMNARMFLKFRSIPPEEEKELIEFFIRHKRFWWVGGITSSLYDLGVACWVKDVLDFHELKDSCIGRFRNKIELLRDSFYSKIYSWRKKYLSEKHTDGMQTVISGRSISVRYDEHDVKLLTQLSIDARLPIVDLANKIGLSVTAVKHRFKRLKDKEVILGFRPKIDLEKLGVYWYKVEFQLDDYRSKKICLHISHLIRMQFMPMKALAEALTLRWNLKWKTTRNSGRFWIRYAKNSGGPYETICITFG